MTYSGATAGLPSSDDDNALLGKPAVAPTITAPVDTYKTASSNLKTEYQRATQKNTSGFRQFGGFCPFIKRAIRFSAATNPILVRVSMEALAI